MIITWANKYLKLTQKIAYLIPKSSSLPKIFNEISSMSNYNKNKPRMVTANSVDCRLTSKISWSKKFARFPHIVSQRCPRIVPAIYLDRAVISQNWENLFTAISLRSTTRRLDHKIKLLLDKKSLCLSPGEGFLFDWLWFHFVAIKSFLFAIYSYQLERN